MRFLSTILTLGFMSQALAAAPLGTIEEEVYISSPSESLVKLISKHPELTIDHRDKLGMELYGPKGTKEWLDLIDVKFSESTHDHGHKSLNSEFADYPTHSEITKFLKKAVALNPKIAKLFSIGKSVDGKELWVVKISDNVEVDEVEPEFKYISSMHGDEITGRELTQFLIKDLIQAYGKDKSITNMINNTEIYIMPSMNPDGSRKKQRANANNVDLNRNFPDFTRGDINTSTGRQPETMAVMKFQSSRNFSLSANFHGGAVVVNYPWDSTYKRHPLDNLLQELSLAYADENPAMRNSSSFPSGITNGADWYVLHGGMQDWSYFWHNDMQVTVELSKKKWPKYKNIPGFYRDNKASMIKYIELIHQGAGVKFSKANVKGKIKITQKFSSSENKDIGTYGFENSEFFKVLEKGTYEFEVMINGQERLTSIEVTVDEDINENGNYTLIN